MGKRRKSREHVLKIFYREDITKENINDIIKSYWQENKVSSEIRDFSAKLAEGIINNKKKIDSYIQKASSRWSIDRMGVIDRNILRMAVQELVFMDDIPPKVTIDEAIEIAKKFGAEDSPDFVNGLLDKIKKESEK